VFITSWIVLAFRPFRFTWWGIASGIFWVPAGAAYVLAVEHAGIGITQATVSSLIITVAMLWGTLFFEEEVSNPGLAACAFLLLAGGVSTMSYFSVPVAEAHPASTKSDGHRQEATGDEVAESNADAFFIATPLHPEGIEETSGAPNDEENRIAARLEPERGAARNEKSLAVGLAAAAFNGIWGGSLMVPMKIAANEGAVTGIDYVVSFGVGVALVTAGMWVLFALWRAASLSGRQRGGKHRPPTAPYDGLPGAGDNPGGRVPPVESPVFACVDHLDLPGLQPRVMAVPGALAGCTWALGNFSAMYATLELGEAIGYSSCQAAVMVSGLWGIFYFGEAPRGALFFGIGALACTAGIILLSLL
jgi:hypothetical protein